jgi:hypothetical protein
MNRKKYIIAAAVLGLFVCATTKAREIKFTTLPEVVRTTVFHHYNITAPEKVVRVVEEPNSIYEVTVLTDGGDQVIYVTTDGSIVERPSTVVEGEQGSTEVTITMDEIKTGGERYEFVQDQGPDAIYIDHQSNKRVIVKGAAGQGSGRSVRTTKENKTSVQTNETNRTNVRTNEENKGSVRTEDKDRQSDAMRDKKDEGTANETDKRENQKTPHTVSRGDQKDQGDRDTVGNGQEQKTRDGSGNPRTQEKNADQRDMKDNQGEKQPHQTTRTPGEQPSQEKSKGRAKPSPSS